MWRIQQWLFQLGKCGRTQCVHFHMPLAARFLSPTISTCSLNVLFGLVALPSCGLLVPQMMQVAFVIWWWCGGGGVVSGVMAAFTRECAVFITSLPMVQLGQLQVALAVAVAFCTLPRSMATDCCTSPCNMVMSTQAVM